jgi:hypothetical protein
MGLAEYRYQFDWLCEIFARKKPPAKWVEMYMGILTEFPIGAVETAIASVAKSSKSFPSAAEVEAACVLARNNLRSTSPSARNQLPCEYRDPKESKASKSLCTKFADDNDATYSRLQFHAVYCSWHGQLAYAKLFPQSTTADSARAILTTAKKEVAGIPQDMPLNVTSMAQAARSVLKAG